MIIEKRQKFLVYLYDILNNWDDADDVLQTVAVKVIQKTETYDPTRAALSTWLYTIAHNTAIDHIRHRSKKRRHVQHDQEKHLVLSREEPIGRKLESEERQSALRHEIAKLSVENQELVTCILQEMPYAEIATKFEIPIGTVKSRVHTIHRRLEKKLVNPT